MPAQLDFFANSAELSGKLFRTLTAMLLSTLVTASACAQVPEVFVVEGSYPMLGSGAFGTQGLIVDSNLDAVVQFQNWGFDIEAGLNDNNNGLGMARGMLGLSLPTYAITP